ncbi:MAG: DUF4097 domain-containing protein [Gemmatimonadota bacterium]|nr:DUF4097 domain-containing protein [Gemmatimonadota bacterium]
MIVAGAALAAALPAEMHAQRERDRDDYESRIDTVVPMGRGGAVELSLTSGEIRVTGSDRNEARVRAYSEHGDLRFESTGSRLQLSVRSRGGRGGRLGDTRYELTIPTGTRVIMRSISGDLAVSGVKGEVEANSTSGDIEVIDAVERVSAETVSGDLLVRQVAGDLRGSTVSGEVQVRSVTGDVEVHSVSGEIELSDIHAKFVRARSTSGDIDLDGTMDSSGRYDLGSHSGSILLAIPSGTGADMSVATFSGDVDSDFQMRLEPGVHATGRPRRLEFRIGNGGARVSAETFSGSIRIVERGSPR